MADEKKVDPKRTPQKAREEVADQRTELQSTRADGQGAAIPRVPNDDPPHTTTVDAAGREAAMRRRVEGEKPAVRAERLAKEAGRKLTGVQTHKAIKRGYAAGVVIEPGDFVPAGVPISDYFGDTPGLAKDVDHEGWMLEADDPKIAEAIQDSAE